MTPSSPAPSPAPHPAPHPASRRRRTGLRLAAAAALLLAAWPTVPAVLGGGFTPNGTQPPTTYEVIDPTVCSACHGDYDFSNNIEPWMTWSGSMMANASRDPIFWAALDVANNDIPGVGDFCLRCHVPTGWLAGRSEPPGGTTDGCSLMGDIDSDSGDFAGVSCHLCHRMMENSSPPMGQQPVYTENAQYWIDDSDCFNDGGGPCRRGPYDYPMAGMDIEPPHEWAYSTYHLESTICGNCHNVTSPANTLIDDSGVDTGIPYPIERTYTEWQQSDFSDQLSGSFATCQDCHMPQAVESGIFACLQNQNDRTGDLAVHQFVGGNTWIPRVLRDEYTNLGRTDQFNATIAWATDMLQNQSATVELLAPTSIGSTDDTLDVSVRVTNLTGHKLPTGYPEGRRMWLNVVARDGNDAVIWESGAYDGATGVLTEDGQVKIYRTEKGIWNENGTSECDVEDLGGNHFFHFVLNDCIKLDNRIPPEGFTGMADPETMPVGYSYPETSPGSGVLVHYDDTDYAIPVPPGTPTPVTVDVALLYQTASKEYIEFLRDEAVNNNFPDDCITRAGAGSPNMSRGELLYDLWASYDRSPPVTMGSTDAEVSVGVPIFSDGFETGDTTAWQLTVN